MCSHSYLLHTSLLINSSTVQCRCLPRATSATGRATSPGTAVSAVVQEAVDPVAVCGMEVAAVCVAIVKSATNVINLGTLHALAPRRRSAAIAATALATSPRIAPRRTTRPVTGATSPAIGSATAPRQSMSAARVAVAAAAVALLMSHAISATAPDTSPRTARRRQRLAMAVARADI